MDRLLPMLIVLSWIHVLVMTFLKELKVFVFARDVIMNQVINSFLMLSQNLKNHSVKVKVLFFIYNASLQVRVVYFYEGKGTNLVLIRAMLRCFIGCSLAEWNCMLGIYFSNAVFKVKFCLHAVCFDSYNCT